MLQANKILLWKSLMSLALYRHQLNQIHLTPLQWNPYSFRKGIAICPPPLIEDQTHTDPTDTVFRYVNPRMNPSIITIIAKSLHPTLHNNLLSHVLRENQQVQPDQEPAPIVTMLIQMDDPDALNGYILAYPAMTHLHQQTQQETTAISIIVIHLRTNYVQQIAILKAHMNPLLIPLPTSNNFSSTSCIANMISKPTLSATRKSWNTSLKPLRTMLVPPSPCFKNNQILSISS